MSDTRPVWRPWGLGLLVLAGAGLAAFGLVRLFGGPAPSDGAAAEAKLTQEVHTFCGACHPYPSPDLFPREWWDYEVRQGYKFFSESGMSLAKPSVGDVVRYYEKRAPEKLPRADIRYATTPPPVRFEPVTWPGPLKGPLYAMSNVNLVHLFDDEHLDVLACDMSSGTIMVLRPSDPKPKWRVLGKTNNPAHVEVIDLDGDGIKDILVADLGNFMPIDKPCGRVVWLRGNKDRTFTPHVLLENVGRVADVQAADFRKTGKLDLVVAEFGLYKFGSILFLENQTTDWSKPKFVPKVIDGRHGAIHVPCRDARGKLVDLNGDGRIDFVALISQEHEAVVAFLNEGNGKFTKKTIYTAPHPAYGSSGIQLVDMNGDGKLDVLYTNGDSLDPPALLKPYHAVQWLENPGDGKYPWKHHLIGPMYGAMRAVAADVNGDGLVDVVAVSFLPKEWVAERKARDRDLDAIVLFEQTSPGKFVRHPLLMEECDHTSCALGDVMGSGRLDLVVGNFGFNVETPVTVWKNLGKPKPRK